MEYVILMITTQNFDRNPETVQCIILYKCVHATIFFYDLCLKKIETICLAVQIFHSFQLGLKLDFDFMQSNILSNECYIGRYY